MRLNEVYGNVYQFSKGTFTNNFVEVKCHECRGPPPIVQNYILLKVQLFYEPRKCPIVLEYYSFNKFTFRNHQDSRHYSRIRSIGTVEGAMENVHTSLNYGLQTAELNWIEHANYFTPSFGSTTRPTLSSDFAFILLDTKNYAGTDADRLTMVSKLKYRSPRSKQGIPFVDIKDEQVIDFILQCSEDAIIMATDLERINQHSFAKKLSDKLKKPIFNYDMRSSTDHSVNVCGEMLVAASPTPGEDNNCEGTQLAVLYFISPELPSSPEQARIPQGGSNSADTAAPASVAVPQGSSNDAINVEPEIQIIENVGCAAADSTVEQPLTVEVTADENGEFIIRKIYLFCDFR